MIYKRFAANLRAQNWFAIGIELGIVVLGVFIGTWVANWNQERAEKRDIAKLLDQMRPQLEETQRIGASQRLYYAATRRYAETALAGWARNPKVSDSDFVIAAYQASQIVGNVTVGQNIALALGGDQVRKIDDVGLRNAAMRVILFDYQPISVAAMLTRYREDVRQIIPDSIQQRVRDECGDQRSANGFLVLPPTCAMMLPPAEAAASAAELRAHPELVRELRFHLAQVASFIINVGGLDQRVDDLNAKLDQRQ